MEDEQHWSMIQLPVCLDFVGESEEAATRCPSPLLAKSLGSAMDFRLHFVYLLSSPKKCLACFWKPVPTLPQPLHINVLACVDTYALDE